MTGTTPRKENVMFRTEHSNRRNLAARMGSWSASHWKTATFGWLALVLLAFAVGSQVGTKQADPTNAGPGESGRIDRKSTRLNSSHSRASRMPSSA